MNVLKATEEQYQELQGYSCDGGVSQMNFSQDGNVPPNWVTGINNKNHPDFECVWDKIDELEVIPWVRPIDPDDTE